MDVNNTSYKGVANTKYIAKLNLELLQENSNQGDKNIVFIIWRYFQCQQGEVVNKQQSNMKKMWNSE